MRRYIAFLVGMLVFCVAAPAQAAPSAAAAMPPMKGPGANFTHDAYVEGMRDVPELLAQAGVACTVTQAVSVGDSTLLDARGKAVGHARLYEAACAEGLGYMINVRGKAPPIAFDCIEGGRSGKIACMLPLNSHPAGGLEPSLKAAGVDCSPVRARYVGEDAGLKLRRYEVNCGAAGGYVLDIPLADGSGPAPRATPCFEVESECQLTPHVQNVAMLAYRAGKLFGADCRIADARYVGYVAAHHDQLYEVSCQAGHDGELIELDHAGALKSSTACSKVKLVGAACQLKPGDAVDQRIADAEVEGARPPGARPTVITNPDWVRKPTAGEFATLFPDRAQRGRVNGRAVILCGVAASGLLVDCAVIDESPAGFGFGAAALQMSRFFQMRPQTRDGVPVSGGRVNIPINFNINRN